MKDVDLSFLLLNFGIGRLASYQLVVFLSDYIVRVVGFCRSLCEVVLKIVGDHGDLGVG